MAPFRRLLLILWPASLLVFLGGCLNPKTSPAGTSEYLIIDLVDEFGFEQPSDSWEFLTPEAWGIRTDGQRRFLYVSPLSAARTGAEAPLETAIHARYRFRNFSFTCRVRTDRGAGGQPCNACVIFGRQDSRNCFRLDLVDLAGKPTVSLVQVDNSQARRLATGAPPSWSNFIQREWHQVGILRNLETGSIEAYVDEERPPLVRAQSSAHAWGTIGLGSTTGGAAFGRVIISGEARAM